MNQTRKDGLSAGLGFGAKSCRGGAQRAAPLRERASLAGRSEDRRYGPARDAASTKKKEKPCGFSRFDFRFDLVLEGGAQA
jgi:hypothetical protein